MNITNTNDTGAGSLRQALSDQSSGTPYRMTFTTSGTIALGSALSITKGNGRISGGTQKVIIASNYSAGTAYTSVASASGLTLDSLAFDNTASGGEGAALLVGDGVSSIAQPYTGFTGRHLYVRSSNDDALGVVGRCRRVRFEYCIFDGAHGTGHAAAIMAAIAGTANPKSLSVVFKHCLFIGGARIPDITFGIVSLLGNVIVRRSNAGKLWAGAKVNLINNYMIDPSDFSELYWPGSPIQLDTSTTFNGEALAAESIYSSGNVRNNLSETLWGSDIYTLAASATPAPATYFRTTPFGTPEATPDAYSSRLLTLTYAGCFANRSTNDANAIAKASNRRPAGSPF